jgi:hypothetical protein
MTPESDLPDLIKHFESHLGPIAGAWTKNAAGELQVQFRQPFDLIAEVAGAAATEKASGVAAEGLSANWCS